MATSKDSWTTIESDPGVFTELLQRMGVQSIQVHYSTSVANAGVISVVRIKVEELYSLDEEQLQRLKPVYGLIFLFKWRGEKDDRPIDHAALETVWFANQVIQNACATQAILSILFNRPDVDIGTELTNLKSFTSEFPPQLKGLTIGNSDVIRTAHNSFRSPEAYISEEDTAGKKDSSEVYHFIGYVPVNGILYELDGLKEGPIRLCDCREEDWLNLVSPFIRARIEQYAKHEIRFNLMAIIKNRAEVLQQQIKEAEEKKEALIASMSVSSLPAEQSEAANAEIMQTEDLILRCKEDLMQEEEKHKKWKEENIRRKHNYIPFLFNFLKVLAEKDQIKDLVELAKEKQQNAELEREERESNADMQE